MNFGIELSICIAAWSLTLIRVRAIHWKDIWKDNGIALYVWLMMMFFSITTAFMIKRFCDYFDALTFNNLDRLFGYCSILIGVYFGALASVEAVGNTSDKAAIHWLRNLLTITIAVLFLIYALFLSKIPNMDYLIPRSLPEVAFMFLAFFFGAILCAFVSKLYFSYRTLERSDVMRARTILIIAGASCASAYFLIKTVTVGGFFWPALGSPFLIDFSSSLLILAILLHFSALLSNRIYLPVVLLFRNVKSWRTFRDLQFLSEKLQQLCPEVAFTSPKPSLWQFLFDPEYFLYLAVVSIMDGKTMLDDFLKEGALQEPALWEGDLLRDAMQVKQALQSIDLSGDFWEITNEYRYASRKLSLQHNPMVKEPSL